MNTSNDNTVVLYDAELIRIDAEAGELIFTAGGATYTVRTQFLRWWTAGTVGCLRLMSTPQSFGFYPYFDQELRRDSAQDDMTGRQWGWRIGDRRLTVKAGVIPGKSGSVIRQDTAALTLDLPREFLNFCLRRRIPPEVVLRGFIADLCELVNRCSCPREDHYSSNGSDERLYAQAYFDRAYGEFESVRLEGE